MTTRVLQLCTSPAFGAPELYVRDYARWLARQGGVQVLLGVLAGARLQQELGELAAPTFALPRRPGRLPWQAARALAAFADAHAVDLIHVHDARDLPLAAFAGRGGRRRGLVVTRHVGLGGSRRDPYHRYLYADVARCLAVSDWVAASARRLLPLPAARIVRVHPGVARREPPGSTAGAAGRFVIGMVARILPERGQHVLLAAAQLLRHQGVPVEIVLAGEVQAPAYMQALAETARAQQVPLRYFGSVSGPGALFAGLDVAVVATRNDPFSHAAAEALRARLPVVAAASGATAEIITDHETGLLFAPDDPVHLAQHLDTLWRDPALRRRLAEAGHRRAERDFDADTQFARAWEASAAG